MTQNEYDDTRIEEHARCLEIIESFANAYVEKWSVLNEGDDGAKAEGWAILQAAAELRKKAPIRTGEAL